MNKHLQLLLELEGLVLMRKGLEQMGTCVDKAGLEPFDERIDRLRRQLPGDLLSRYDRLARKYPDTIAVVSENICQGCHEGISRRLATAVEKSEQLQHCEHCGRFLFAQQQAPDYVTVA